MNSKTKNILAQRVLGAVDLAIDFATLGQYGLEPLPADGPGRKRPGHATGWEALSTARRRGACVGPRPARSGSELPRAQRPQRRWPRQPRARIRSTG